MFESWKEFMKIINKDEYYVPDKIFSLQKVLKSNRRILQFIYIEANYF